MLATERQDRQGGSEASSATPCRVFIVDDHEFFRTGVIAWLEQQKDVQYCGDAASLQEARARLSEAEADLVLLDLALPDGDGLEFIREARTLHPALKVIVLSQRDEAVFAERALKQGASGYLMKSEASELLLEAVAEVMGGGTWLSRAAQAMADPLEMSTSLRKESGLGDLSDRELQVFALVGAGHGPRDIARRLGISTKTVEAHREHIRHKLGLRNAIALLQVAQRWVREGKI